MKTIIQALLTTILITGCLEMPTGSQGKQGTAGERGRDGQDGENSVINKSQGYLKDITKGEGYWDIIYYTGDNRLPIVDVYVRTSEGTMWMEPAWTFAFQEEYSLVAVRIFETLYWGGSAYKVDGWEYLITVAY